MKVSRSLTQVRFGRLAEFSSRADSITCRSCAVDAVAVVVHRDEVVVGADLLDLPERLEQRLVIPQPHVLERGGIAGDVVRVSRRRRTVARSSTLVEREGAPRRVDVVLDERRLARLLVGRDDEALHDAAVDLAADRHGDIEADGDRNRPVRRDERVPRRQSGTDDRDRHQQQRAGMRP